MKKKQLMGFMTTLMFAAGGIIPSSVVLAHDEDEPPPPGNISVLAPEIMVGGFNIGLETVATGLTAPNWGTANGIHSGRLYVTDQIGILWNIDLTGGAVECDADDPGSSDCAVFLDTRGLLVDLGIIGPGSFDERGLLGVAFHTDYANNGLLYTYTSEPNKGKADFSTMPKGVKADHQAVIREWEVSNPVDSASVVDPSSTRVLLRIDQPQFNHDGGGVNYGPDGLYISLGDGGAADDQAPGHNVADGNAQDTSNVLGTILRIDPQGDNSANGDYGIPANNPFAGGAGCDAGGGCDEIYAYGLRNPFRFSFDKDTDDLYIADVGQNDIEEVDVIVAGDNSGPNFGWRLKEGSFFFVPDGGTDFPCNQGENGSATNGCAVEDDPGIGDPGVLAGVTDPVAEYETHTEGHAVIGGFVYRGTEIEQLAGRYVFGDFGLERADEPPIFREGRLFVLTKKDIVANGSMFSKVEELKDGANNPIELGLDVEGGGVLLGLGQDADGELYVMANETSVPFNDPETGDPTGVVLKIVPLN